MIIDEDLNDYIKNLSDEKTILLIRGIIDLDDNRGYANNRVNWYTKSLIRRERTEE